MKKIITIIIAVTISLLINTINVNAQNLDCSVLLKNGSRGDNVRALQTILNKKESCNLTVDGIFGSRTKSCVEQYQAHNNLKVDGIVGKDTCNVLNGNKTAVSKSNNTTNYTSSNVVKIYKKTNTVKAVVIADGGANVRSSASTSSRKIGKVKLGKVVMILGQEGNWYKIQGNNNTVGYIRTDLVSKNCIVVDISNQKLIVFTNGSKDWSTNVITGDKNNHDTPIGSYILSPTNFIKNVDLVGDGYSSHVDYWMPFITERGIGFHDAYWRKAYQYNTSTYQGNGSHGCVNMQHEAAEKLYTSITANTNVVVRK